MRGHPIIVDTITVSGRTVEKQRFSDTLGGWLPEFFYVCRGVRPFDIGTGDTPQEAIERLEKLQCA